MLSIPHMIVVFLVALVVFGPQKLPELARGLGKLLAEFRKASTDFRTSFEEEMRDLERQAREAERRKAETAAATVATPVALPGGEETVSPAPDGSELPAPEANSEAPPLVESAAEEPGVLPETVARTSEPSSTVEAAETHAAPPERIEDSIHDEHHHA